MSARARAALGERDANHASVAAWYAALWCQTLDTSTLGQGFPDLIVKIGTAKGPILALVEVKTRDGELSPSQKRFARDFGCVTIVRTQADVCEHVNAVRARFK